MRSYLNTYVDISFEKDWATVGCYLAASDVDPEIRLFLGFARKKGSWKIS